MNHHYDSPFTHHDLSRLSRSDAELLLHPASSIAGLLEQGPQMMHKARGCVIEDKNGHRYLDAVGGLWCVNVGYGRQELAEVMRDTAVQLGYYHSFSNASNPWQVALAEKLLSLAPGGLDKVFFGNGGSDANDTLIKIAWHYHTLRGKLNKVKVIARERAYHGTSISTSSLTGLDSFHTGYPLPLDFVLRTHTPCAYTEQRDDETSTEFCNRLINHIALLIEQEGADTIAAFIAEPIMGAGGIVVPPDDYFPRLQALLKAHDILLIADEVVCAFGRLGHWFGSPIMGIQPDMISTAKGLTSGYFPLSAALISNSIWEVLKTGSEQLGAFSHGYTYSGHPVGCAVGLANLQLLENEGLISRAREQGAYLHQQLKEQLLPLDIVGEVRGMGLLAGIQLTRDKLTRALPEAAEKWPLRISQAIRQRGVIVRPLPSVATLAISPPLTISRKQILQLVTVIRDGIEEFEAALPASELR